jgi:uncharacterized protein YuzE
MAIRQINPSKTNELIVLAKKRGDIPNDWIKFEYQKDADLLFILYSREECVNSKGDMENGLIRNYDTSGQLVSIEVLDVYGIFSTV